MKPNTLKINLNPEISMVALFWVVSITLLKNKIDNFFNLVKFNLLCGEKFIKNYLN